MEGQEKERLRSPNYPAFGLPTAIERARALYDRDKKAAVHVTAAIKAWGYNTLNGRSLRVLGALRQYGLLEDAGAKMVRLSQTALAILLGDDGSDLRRKAIHDAARSPQIFADLMEQYKEGYPSAETMTRNLALSTNYSEEAAGRLIAAFRETVDLVEGVGSADTSGANGDTGDDPDEERHTPDRKPKQREGRMAESGRESLDYPIPLIGGGQAVLRLPRSMSEEDYVLVTSFLETMLKGLKKALVTSSPPPAQPGVSGEGS